MANNVTRIESEKGDLIAVIDEYNRGYYYLESMKDVEKYKREGLVLATMPVALELMLFFPEVKKALWPKDYFDTVSSEFFGMRNGERSYEVLHGPGPLATSGSLEQYLNQSSSNFTVEI